jgi:hypothetical protein
VPRHQASSREECTAPQNGRWRVDYGFRLSAKNLEMWPTFRSRRRRIRCTSAVQRLPPIIRTGLPTTEVTQVGPPTEAGVDTSQCGSRILGGMTLVGSPLVIQGSAQWLVLQPWRPVGTQAQAESSNSCAFETRSLEGFIVWAGPVTELRPKPQYQLYEPDRQNLRRIYAVPVLCIERGAPLGRGP